MALGVSAAGWVCLELSGRSVPRTVAALAVMGIAGGVLAGLSPLSPALAIGCMATSAAGVRLNTETSLAITAGTVAAFLSAALAAGAPIETMVGYPLAFIGLWAFGLTRHAYLLRAEQAERTLAETRRAREAEAHAAAPWSTTPLRCGGTWPSACRSRPAIRSSHRPVRSSLSR